MIIEQELKSLNDYPHEPAGLLNPRVVNDRPKEHRVRPFSIVKWLSVGPTKAEMINMIAIKL